MVYYRFCYCGLPELLCFRYTQRAQLRLHCRSSRELGFEFTWIWRVNSPYKPNKGTRDGPLEAILLSREG